MSQTNRGIIFSSLFWKLMESGGTQGVQFIVQLFLARLLLPEEYGIIAIVSVFILFANVFVQSGLNTALIQKKDADEIDFSSVFYLGLLIASILYLILFLAAPFIANLYKDLQLISVLRVLSLMLFFGAVNSIQNAYIAKNMMFKKLFYSSVGAIFISGIIGIYTAYSGWGVWALVAQQLSNNLVVTIILWYTVKWRPSLLFSFDRIKILFNFGWKLLVSSLLNTLYMNLRTLVIGLAYSSDMLGFYNRGKQFPEAFVVNINGSIQSVMLPVLSSTQDDLVKVKSIVRRAIVISSFVIFPMMVGLAVVAEPLISLLLTDKWVPAVPFLQIYCAIFALKPLNTANLQVISALGRSDIFLRLETLSTIIGIIVLIISIPFGVDGIAWGALISGVLSTFIYTIPNLKLINYGFMEQIKDIFPSLFISIIMGIIIFTLRILQISNFQLFLVQITTGIIIYVILAKILNLSSFKYLIDTIKNFKKKQ